MGADFIYAYVPVFKITEERKQIIINLILDLKPEDFSSWWRYEDEEDIHQKYIHEVLVPFWEIGEYRCVGTWYDRTAEVKEYWLTGGESWGDAPTTSFNILQGICMVDALYSLCYQFALEDQR